MRIRSLFFCLPALALLAACAKDPLPVRLDFVGGTGLLSGSRTVTAGDTLVTRVYGESNNGQPLQHLRIDVTYEPGPAPILYPIPTSSFDAAKAPAALPLVYLDSLLPAGVGVTNRGSETLFANGLMARTTSGKETWTYTVSDASGQTAARGYHLTVHKSDSAAVFHSYPLLLRPMPAKAPRPASVRDSRRVFLNLRYGMLLPKYAVLNNSQSLQANQKRIDLVCVANQAGTAVNLVAPFEAANGVAAGTVWPTGNRRATEIHALGLTAAQFTGATTSADFLAAFTASTPYQSTAGPSKTNSGPLATGQVIAFKALDDNDVTYYGLLQVTAFTGGTNPVVTCLVKVQKY